MRSQTAPGAGRKSGPMRPAPVAAAQAATRIRKTAAAIATKPVRPIRAPMRKIFCRRRRRIGPVTRWLPLLGRVDETRVDQSGGGDVLIEDARLLRCLEHVGEGLLGEI